MVSRLFRPVIALACLMCGGQAALAVSYTETSGLTPPSWDGGRTEVEMADIDLDGHVDLVSIGDHGSPYINTDQHGIMVWRGDGACGWTVHMNGHFGYGGVAVGDVNNDGHYDVGYSMHHDYSSSDFGDQLIEVALGDGGVSTWSPWDDGLATNGESWGMFGTDFGDVNHDGWLDLVSNSFGASSGVHVYLNQGDGSWVQSFGFTGGNSTDDVVFGDIDNDGHLDFAAAHQYGTAYFGDGAGGFAEQDAGLPPTGSVGRRGIALGDVDNDGGCDLAFVNSDGGVEVWAWDTIGTTWTDFGGDLPAGGSFQATQLCDMDVDGYMDVAAFGGGQFQLWRGDGGGTWTPAAQFTTPSPGTFAAFRTGGDVDHNGYPDLVIVAREGSWPSDLNEIHFFKEETVAHRLTLTLIFPHGYEFLRENTVSHVKWFSAVPAGTDSWVHLEFSSTGESGPWTTIADSLPNNGCHQWQVPSGIASDQCRIRATALTSEANAISVNPENFTIMGETVAVDGGDNASPQSLYSVENHPNPFNPRTIIVCTIPVDSRVNLGIYDLRGRLVNNLLTDDLAAGQHSWSWDGTGEDGAALPAGTYLYRMQAGAVALTGRAVLVR